VFIAGFCDFNLIEKPYFATNRQFLNIFNLIFLPLKLCGHRLRATAESHPPATAAAFLSAARDPNKPNKRRTEPT